MSVIFWIKVSRKSRKILVLLRKCPGLTFSKSGSPSIYLESFRNSKGVAIKFHTKEENLIETEGSGENRTTISPCSGKGTSARSTNTKLPKQKSCEKFMENLPEPKGKNPKTGKKTGLLIRRKTIQDPLVVQLADRQSTGAVVKNFNRKANNLIRSSVEIEVPDSDGKRKEMISLTV